MERIHVPDKVLKKMKEEQDFEVQENGAQALRSFGFFFGDLIIMVHFKLMANGRCQIGSTESG